MTHAHDKALLERKLCALLFLAGGSLYRLEDARTILLLVQRDYPKFLSLMFDGRIFGLVSSETERALKRMHQYGYLDKYYIRSMKSSPQPIHEFQELSLLGRQFAQDILSDRTFRQEAGLNDRIPELVTDILCGSILTSGFSTALGLYLSSIEGNDNIRKATEMIEGEAPITTIYDTISLGALEMAKAEYEASGLIRMGSPIKIDAYNACIPYEIVKEGIRKRYSYLFFDSKQLEFFLRLFEGSHPSKSLIMELASKRVPKQLADRRLSNLAKLFELYPNIPELFSHKVVTYLNVLKRHLSEIQNGYERVFALLERIAELSKMEGKSLDEMLSAYISWGPDYTCFKMIAPDCIRLNNSIIEGMGDKVWHFGMDCHVNHTPQFPQVSYLIQKKGLVRNHLNRR